MIKNSIRRSWNRKEDEEESKYPRMTKEAILRVCKENKLYMTPWLNDVLYLHFKGYSKIENLEEYSGLKCLWLENNGIAKIENLDNQKELKSLYLHHNLIKEIENLEDACPLLDSLNLCHNNVSKIQNLSRLSCLHTLNISHNRLQDYSDLVHLKECKELSCLDISHNWVDDPAVVDIFEAMESLRVLYLTGNPVIRKIPSYRKNLTVRCKLLTYLDDRPVFPKDRAAAEAWSVGGLEAERECRQKWAEEERAKITASVKSILLMRDKAKAQREEKREFLEFSDHENREDEDSSEESAEEFEGMEGGDTEDNRSNRIIFPWMYRNEEENRRQNNHGEGGRSLIVEIADIPNEEAPAPKHVGKGYDDPEIRDKLREALQAAEWLTKEEKSQGEMKEYIENVLIEEFEKKISLNEDDVSSIREEVDAIIDNALDIATDKVVDEDEANAVIDNAVKIVDELNNIGNFPLTLNEVPSTSASGVNDEFNERSVPSEDERVTEEVAPTVETIDIVQDVPHELPPVIEVEKCEDDVGEPVQPNVTVYEKNISRSLELQIIEDKDNVE